GVPYFVYQIGGAQGGFVDSREGITAATAATPAAGGPDGRAREVGPPRPLAVMARQCTGIGPRGVVCAAAPLAAQAGAAVLREGGNAYDAVVAMGLAESVLLPP